jgi:7,8-dihydro-6-hydroxymethylpterin-pyrophosphokinase
MKMDYVKNAITEYDLDILFIQEAELKKIPKKTCTAYKVTQRNFVLL